MILRKKGCVAWLMKQSSKLREKSRCNSAESRDAARIGRRNGGFFSPRGSEFINGQRHPLAGISLRNPLQPPVRLCIRDARIKTSRIFIPSNKTPAHVPRHVSLSAEGYIRQSFPGLPSRSTSPYILILLADPRARRTESDKPYSRREMFNNVRTNKGARGRV